MSSPRHDTDVSKHNNTPQAVRSAVRTTSSEHGPKKATVMSPTHEHAGTDDHHHHHHHHAAADVDDDDELLWQRVESMPGSYPATPGSPAARRGVFESGKSSALPSWRRKCKYRNRKPWEPDMDALDKAVETAYAEYRQVTDILATRHTMDPYLCLYARPGSAEAGLRRSTPPTSAPRLVSTTSSCRPQTAARSKSSEPSSNRLLQSRPESALTVSNYSLMSGGSIPISPPRRVASPSRRLTSFPERFVVGLQNLGKLPEKKKEDNAKKLTPLDVRMLATRLASPIPRPTPPAINRSKGKKYHVDWSRLSMPSEVNEKSRGQGVEEVLSAHTASPPVSPSHGATAGSAVKAVGGLGARAATADRLRHKVNPKRVARRLYEEAKERSKEKQTTLYDRYVGDRMYRSPVKRSDSISSMCKRMHSESFTREED